MHRTLLLCFIHGFKGGDDTFAGFPEHLRALTSHALPNITVKAVTYPKFETRGDLKDCVGRLREWLQNKVIDLEVAASTPSPTVDPSVHTILIGHSMGGIVAAETLLAITSDSPIPSQKDPLPSMASQTVPGSQPPPTDSEGPTFMFPYIQGILAFDTPYLGISPGVVAHGAEQHYRAVTGAYSALSEVAGVLGYGASKKDTSPKQQQDNQKLLTQGADAMSVSMTNASSDAAAVPAWQKWGKYAMFAGAAGAVAAGGAAAYLKRDTITEGWSFIGSHLEFVGCLARGEELKSRLERIVELNKDRNIGFADIITVLGKGAVGDKRSGTTVPNTGGIIEIGSVDGIAPSERTFCTVPKSEKNRKFFEKAKNDKASDEMQAHMTMFTARENSGYFTLGERSRDLIVQWVKPEASEWYRESEPEGGIKKIPQEDENGHGPTLPKWVAEYNKCLKSPQRKENRAAVAISAMEIDRRVRDAVRPGKLRARPPKLGPSKVKLALAEAEEQNRADGVATLATPPTTPRGRPSKVGIPTAGLESTKLTEANDNARSVTPNRLRRAKPPKIVRAAADIELTGGQDQAATPEAQPRKPPKLGRPTAETVSMTPESKSAKTKQSTPNTELQSSKAETSTPTFEREGAKTETSTMVPGADSAKEETGTTAYKPRNDETETNIANLGPEGAQGEINQATPDIARVETSEAPPESGSAEPETSENTSKLSKALDLGIGGPDGVAPEEPRPQPRTIGRPQAGLASREHNAKNAPTLEPDSVTAETSATAPNLRKPPEIQIEGAGGAGSEGPCPKPKPPKIGRPKAELESGKPRKLPKKYEISTREKPYSEHPKLGKSKAHIEPNHSKSEQTTKERGQKARNATAQEMPQKIEVRSKHVKNTRPPSSGARPPETANPKAEAKATKPSKLAKDGEAPESTPEKPPKADFAAKEIKPERAPEETNQEATPEGLHPGPPNDAIPPIGRTRPPKLEKRKPEPVFTGLSKPPGKNDGARDTTPKQPAKAELESQQMKPEQAPKGMDEGIGGATPETSHPRPLTDAIPSTGRPSPRKLDKPKAEIGSTKSSKLAKKKEI